MSKYIDAEKLIAEIARLYKQNTCDFDNGCNEDQCYGYGIALSDLQIIIDSLQQELDSRSIPVLRADTTEKQNRILEIIGQDEIYCHFSLDSGKETDCGYEDYNDRVYIDGDLTFNKMAEIVNFLSKNSK